jgi:hypothetical protein
LIKVLHNKFVSDAEQFSQMVDESAGKKSVSFDESKYFFPGNHYRDPGEGAYRGAD